MKRNRNRKIRTRKQRGGAWGCDSAPWLPWCSAAEENQAALEPVAELEPAPVAAAELEPTPEPEPESSIVLESAEPDLESPDQSLVAPPVESLETDSGGRRRSRKKSRKSKKGGKRRSRRTRKRTRRTRTRKQRGGNKACDNKFQGGTSQFGYKNPTYDAVQPFWDGNQY